MVFLTRKKKKMNKWIIKKNKNNQKIEKFGGNKFESRKFLTGKVLFTNDHHHTHLSLSLYIYIYIYIYIYVSSSQYIICVCVCMCVSEQGLLNVKHLLLVLHFCNEFKESFVDIYIYIYIYIPLDLALLPLI